MGKHSRSLGNTPPETTWGSEVYHKFSRKRYLVIPSLLFFSMSGIVLVIALHQLHGGVATTTYRDMNHATLLHRAAYKGYTETVTALIDMHADINAKDNIGQTPLHKAAFQGQTETVDALLDSGADTRAKRQRRQHTPCIMRFHRVTSKPPWLSSTEAADIDAKDNDGNTPLHNRLTGSHRNRHRSHRQRLRCSRKKQRRQHTLCIISFTGSHRNRHAFSSAGFCRCWQKTTTATHPLHNAASQGNTETAIALIDKDARHSRKRQRRQHTPAVMRLHRVTPKPPSLSSARSPTLTQKTNMAKPSCIMRPFTGCHMKSVIALTDRGANILAKTTTATLPLHNAASQGHIETTMALIGRGADIEAKDNDGNTPLHNRGFRCDPSETATALLDEWCRHQAKDNGGNTPSA